jgi:eukaryotic-like serine/threonine-protein kinase
MTGETIAGRYRLLEPLGRGAMSAVWLAHDDELERKVAVKMLAPSADRARFEREARAAASLSHPNICALYDYGEADGRPYMVLEYLPNGSLEERLPPGQPLADAETARIATAIAAGLAHAHDRGLVHRDLKPANVLFDSEERPKIADFGIARMGTSGTLTEAGTVLGTASYISPEQASGLPAGPASDVYSFGVILFRMLTGAFPFVSTNAMELVRMHRDDTPRTVAELRPNAPARLESIVVASLAKDPAERPRDGAALLRELRGEVEASTMLLAPGAAGAASEATQVLRPRPAGRGRRRPPVVPIAALTGLLLIAGGALAVVLTHDGASGATTSTPAALTLRSVPSTASTTAQTTAPTTTPSTTASTTTRAITTAPVTVAPPPPTTATTAPATTTAAAPTTTTPVTTDTAPTTTALGTTTTTTPAP